MSSKILKENPGISWYKTKYFQVEVNNLSKYLNKKKKKNDTSTRDVHVDDMENGIGKPQFIYFTQKGMNPFLLFIR